MQESQTSSLFAALDMVVLARDQDGDFHLPGRAPEWFSGFCPDCSLDSPIFDAAMMSPYLEAFVDSAAPVWAAESGFPVAKRSGWWTRMERDGAVHYFQATAVRLPRSRLLIIRHESGDSEIFSALSGYKEGFLALGGVEKERDRCTVELSQLKELSVTDELTGLPNERGFFALAGQQVDAAKRKKLGNIILTVSLEDLARLNEQYGHTEGSMAIVAASDILRKTFGGQSVVARLRGSEFAVLALETAYATEAVYLAHLAENLEAYNKTSFKTYALRLVAGAVRLLPEFAGTLREALEKSGAAMREKRKEKK